MFAYFCVGIEGLYGRGGARDFYFIPASVFCFGCGCCCSGGCSMIFGSGYTFYSYYSGAASYPSSSP